MGEAAYFAPKRDIYSRTPFTKIKINITFYGMPISKTPLQNSNNKHVATIATKLQSPFDKLHLAKPYLQKLI